MMSSGLKRVAVLGSTGSIGRQTLQVLRAFPEKFQVVALSAGRNTRLLKRQVDEFKPWYIYYLVDESKTEDFSSGRFLSIEEIAGHSEVDTVVIATSGTSAMEAALAAARAGKNIALANKESLVTAGEILIDEVSRNNARILPVDSEHSAIWQCLNGEKETPKRIILTASGGPFRNLTKSKLDRVTPEDALAHPSWRMGRKITIDSATLMNKGLEIIEAHWLFNIPLDNISVIIHPQSIIHSMIEFTDGSVKAQMSPPDMRLPIQYALTWPERQANADLPSLDFKKANSLTFEQPDIKKFPCLRLAIEAGQQGGTYPATLCAADEAAVELFLDGKIRFTDIPVIIEKTLKQHKSIKNPDLHQIIDAGKKARDIALELGGGSSEL
jgi:1-deoxy-D-xylulose-5-phosphate reductoisomerase